MSQFRKYAMAGATFSAALGIGFVMQNGDALASKVSAPDEAVIADATSAAMPETMVPETLALEIAAQDIVAPETMAPETMAIAETSPDIGPALNGPDAAPTVAIVPPLVETSPAETSPQPIQLALADGSTLSDTLPESLPETLPVLDDVAVASTLPSEGLQAPLAPPSVDCTISLEGKVSAGAMVDLDVFAPCNLSAEFTLHHQGLMITGLTDEAGRASLAIPALGETAVFVAAFGNDNAAIATVAVPELAFYDRAVLQWQGDIGVGMQVYEFGADFGSEGHVSASSPRDITALDDSKGFMTQLGTKSALGASYVAQVYTFPAGSAATDGTIRVSAEAEITAANCGRDIAAQSIQISPGSEPIGEDLTLTMPGCDGIGDLLLLDAMFEEFAVAAN